MSLRQVLATTGAPPFALSFRVEMPGHTEAKNPALSAALRAPEQDRIERSGWYVESVGAQVSVVGPERPRPFFVVDVTKVSLRVVAQSKPCQSARMPSITKVDGKVGPHSRCTRRLIVRGIATVGTLRWNDSKRFASFTTAVRSSCNPSCRSHPGSSRIVPPCPCKFSHLRFQKTQLTLKAAQMTSVRPPSRTLNHADSRRTPASRHWV